MSKKVLIIGEYIFNVIFIIAIVAGLGSSVMAALNVGGVNGIILGLIQLLLSWSGTLIIGLIVYSLLEIRKTLCVTNSHHQ
jgi:hypothetical protein